MIRALWVSVVLFVSTFYHGTVVLVASLFGVSGDLYSRFTQTWARSILSASAVPITVEGFENLRPGKPQIVVSNHVSGYDILALAAVLPRPFAFVGKKELDRIPFFGRVWVAAGHISIDRSDRKKALATLQEAGRRIRDEGSTVIMFPEGTRSTTGQMLPFKRGAFALAVESGVPVIPTVILGSDRIWQQGSARINPHPIIVRFGIPLEPGRPGEGGLDLLAETTRQRMQQLLDEPADLAQTAGRVSGPP